MQQPKPHQLDEARKWASQALALLAEMPPHDRTLWRATKPRGEMFFNWRKVKFVCLHFPDLRSQFVDLGVA